MSDNAKFIIPDLTFPGLYFGKYETPWDLRRLLYLRGAETKSIHVDDLIAQGKLGEIMEQRISLVVGVHEYFLDFLGRGNSRSSVLTGIDRIRNFFSWLDANERAVSLDTVSKAYVSWTGWLKKRADAGDFTRNTAYMKASGVSKILDGVIGTGSKLILMSLVKGSQRNADCKGRYEPSEIDASMRFGEYLLDITKSLTAEAIFGTLPVLLNFRSGDVLEEWLRLAPEEELRTLRDGVKASTRDATLEKRSAYESRRTLDTRAPLANLRIKAEMLIFISQTGMNLTDAQRMTVGNFRYRSDIEGYQVYRVFKRRKHGEVEFCIYKEYRQYFEAYLRWRDILFPESKLLFPIIGVGVAHRPPSFRAIATRCKRLGIKYFPPLLLRGIRQNWILRRSNDPALTAEMGSHSEEVLLREYHEPSREVATLEIAKYHQKDPIVDCPGPGVCISANAEPKPIDTKPVEASNPDCINPAGCMFCDKYRDIDSVDYVWSLTTYRHLKTIELALYPKIKKDEHATPALAIIEKITDKLKAFAQSGKLKASWVDEAVLRIEEEDYHPRWDGFVRLMEV